MQSKEGIPVDKLNVRVLKDQMNKCFAKAIVIGGGYSELEASKMCLEKGTGIFISLKQLELLNEEEIETAEHDIKHIEDKQAFIRREKEAEIYARHMKMYHQ